MLQEDGVTTPGTLENTRYISFPSLTDIQLIEYLLLVEILSLHLLFRKVEPSQTLKLLPSSTDDSSKKHVLGVSCILNIFNFYLLIFFVLDCEMLVIVLF